MIRTNVRLEKKQWQTTPESSLGGMLLREVEQGGYIDAVGLWYKQDEYLTCLCSHFVPNCEEIGYKLENEVQVPGLGAIFTSFCGNFKWLQCIHTQTQKLPLSRPISVPDLLQVQKVQLSPRRFRQAAASLHCTGPFTFAGQAFAHKLSVNVFLSHI